jgi:arginine utilization protein RocB
MARTVLHSPTLASVRMVEKTIRKYSQEYGKYQLWKKLPKKMMYQTFQEILSYLEESGKIMIDKKDGCVFWTWNPSRIKKLIKEGLIVR